MKLSFSRRVVAAAAAVLTSAAAVLTVSGVAQAQPGNYVAFGDSFPANPGFTDEQNDTGRPGYVCPVSETNVGHQVAQRTGLELRDYTCNGTVVYMPTPKALNIYVDQAIERGSLDHNTKLVTFFVGANDTMQAFWAPTDIQDNMFRDSMVAAIDKVKQHTKDAKIMIIGYPEITSRDDVHFACPVNAFGFAPQVPAAPVHVVEMSLQQRQIDAANRTGVQFINMKDVSNVNVAMCGRDGERQVSAFLDSDIGTYNMTNHLTHHGSRVFGDVIANAYRG